MDVSFTLLVGIIAIAMLAKYFILKRYEQNQAITRFVIFLSVFTLLLWFLIPDPKSHHVLPEVKYIGLPIIVFGVPVISFFSYILRDEKPDGFSIQDFAEILFVPVWLVICYAAIFALNWVWI